MGFLFTADTAAGKKPTFFELPPPLIRRRIRVDVTDTQFLTSPNSPSGFEMKSSSHSSLLNIWHATYRSPLSLFYLDCAAADALWLK